MHEQGVLCVVMQIFFMKCLIHSRCKRGLAGSLIGLGEVKGVGYAARLERKLNVIIGATLPLSEKEVHHMRRECYLGELRVGQIQCCMVV